MPLYEWRCRRCGERFEMRRSVAEHDANPRPFVCCGEQAERYFEAGSMPALHNVLAGDRHYDGLRAPDGTDISSRTKHREYMRRHGLTTADDFSHTWAKAAERRAEALKGHDPQRAHDVAQALRSVEAGYKPRVQRVDGD